MLIGERRDAGHCQTDERCTRSNPTFDVHGIPLRLV
jgi:hypothetical protein